MSHRERAEKLVGEVHDPGQAALIHALLAVVDAIDALDAPGEPEPEVPFEQTKEGWKW